MTPFFSIVVPTYNRAETLVRCIDSILSQSFHDWELIIVDDGSTDNTIELIKSYNDKRIRYIWQENQERSVARNRGVSLAKGKWICFLDSDDEYFDDHLTVLHSEISSNKEIGIFRTGLKIFINNNYVRNSDQEYQKLDQYPYEALQSYVFRLDLAKSNTFNIKYKRGEDLYFLYKIMENEQFLHIKNKWTVKYNYDPKSSYGFGANYRDNLLNYQLFFNDFLMEKPTSLLQFIKMKLCETSILKLKGDFLTKDKRVFATVLENINLLFKYPREYIGLVIKYLC